MTSKLSISILQVLIYFIVLSIAGGSFFLDFRVAGFQFYGFRIIIILSLVYLLFTRNLVFSTGKLTKYVSVFFIVWILYALISFSWCPDLSLALKDLFYITFGYGVYLTVLSLKTKWANFNTDFFTAWIITLLFVILASLWEIYTEQHLEGSLVKALAQLGVFHDLHGVPVFTFDNPNHYAIYISASMCILFYLLIRNKYPQFITVLLSICVYLLVAVNSRFAFIFFGLAVMLFLWVRFRRFKIGAVSIRNSLIFISLGSLLYLGIFSFHDTIRVHNDLKVRLIQMNKAETAYADSILLNNECIAVENDVSENTVIKLETSAGVKSSVNVRKNLIYNGFEFIKISKFMGVGAGGFRALMLQDQSLHPTEGIHTPHNYVIEILSQYGIIIFILFAFIFIYILYLLWLGYMRNGFTNDHFLVLIMILCFMLMSNANSSFLPLPINWIMFALIIVFAEGLSEKSKIENAGEN